jgi:hypothetical protein
MEKGRTDGFFLEGQTKNDPENGFEYLRQIFYFFNFQFKISPK